MINTHKLGLVLGGFAGLIHIVWVILVGLGWAGPLLAFIYRIHFIDFSFAITEFSFGGAVTLIVLTSFIGYVLGNIIGLLWNFVYKEADENYVVDKGY
ncbi:MAG: hypothetical protein Q7R72_01780 [bacterium]|nr:hypothetical protein [bacterium]